MFVPAGVLAGVVPDVFTDVCPCNRSRIHVHIRVRIDIRIHIRIHVGIRPVGFEMSLETLSMQQTRFDPIKGVPGLHRLDGLAKRFEKMPAVRRAGHGDDT